MLKYDSVSREIEILAVLPFLVSSTETQILCVFRVLFLLSEMSSATRCWTRAAGLCSPGVGPVLGPQRVLCSVLRGPHPAHQGLLLTATQASGGPRHTHQVCRAYIQYYAILRYTTVTVLYNCIPYYTVLCHTIPYYTILLPSHTMTIRYCTILLPYHNIIYYYHTIL